MRFLFGTARVFVLALFFVFIASPAWANPAQEAAEFYGQASEAYQSGEYQKAADLLDLAFGKNPDLVYKYNRILALQAAGDAATALAELNALYSPMKADPQKRFDDIDEIKAQLEALTEPKSTPEPVDTTPTEPPPTEPPPMVPEQPKAKAAGPSPLGLTLTIAGGAVLTTGVLFSTGIFVPKVHKDCIGLGSDPAVCNGTTFDKAKEVRSRHIAAAVSMLGVGAISTALGVVVLLTSNRGGGESALQVTPYVAGDGMGAVLRMRF